MKNTIGALFFLSTSVALLGGCTNTEVGTATGAADLAVESVMLLLELL